MLNIDVTQTAKDAGIRHPTALSDGGEFDWDGGTIGLTGSGGATFLANADLKIQGSDTKTVSAGKLTYQCNGSEIGGTGTLMILNGATFDSISSPNCDVSISSIATTGTGTFINDADGFFDAKGDTTISGNFTNLGTLEVSTASSLTLSGAPVGSPPGGGAPVIALDGTVQLDGDLTLLGEVTSPTGFIEDAGGGTLKVGDGSTAGSLSVASGYEALLSGNLEVSGTGTLGGAGEVYNNGKLTVDVGAGTSLGSYQQTSAGTLALQAAAVDVFSSLAVSGSAQLSGTLELDFLDGYTPTSGTTFPVLTATSIGAHFDTTPDNMMANYTSTGVSVTEN